MASALNKQRDYKYIADKYSQLNEPQVEFGKKLVVLLDLKHGDKVLDMGCGTGEMTTFIADQVGEEGEVLGVDPDEERIKVAVQKNCEARRNIKFITGNSSSHFPHYNEGYYDAHFSNYVFHWLDAEERDVYIKSAASCLKSGGRIAMNSMYKNAEISMLVPQLMPDEEIENNLSPCKFITKSVAESMLVNAGFKILSSKFFTFEYSFSSLDHYLTWYCVSGYIDESKIVPHKKEAFAKKFVNEDGSVYVAFENYQIIAEKN